MSQEFKESIQEVKYSQCKECHITLPHCHCKCPLCGNPECVCDFKDLKIR